MSAAEPLRREAERLREEVATTQGQARSALLRALRLEAQAAALDLSAVIAELLAADPGERPMPDSVREAVSTVCSAFHSLEGFGT